LSSTGSGHTWVGGNRSEPRNLVLEKEGGGQKMLAVSGREVKKESGLTLRRGDHPLSAGSSGRVAKGKRGGFIFRGWKTQRTGTRNKIKTRQKRAPGALQKT